MSVRATAVLGLVALGAACGSKDSGPGEPERAVTSAVLFTVDTLRADRLGCYGGSVPTPSVDRLAAEGLLFERAYSQATFTHPALSSILTGLLPPHHRVETQSNKLAPIALPLQVQLSKAGYRTGSFVANLCTLQDVTRTVFHDGWDELFCGMDTSIPHHRWDEAVVSAGLDWIAAQDQPFFAWIHLIDPHAEYDPLAEFWDHEGDPLKGTLEQRAMLGDWEKRGEIPPPEFLDRVNALYDAEVRGVDIQVGRLLEGLAAHPDGDRIALIFSADHGEELYETWAKSGHALSLSEGVLHVPLIVRAQGVAPERRREAVETLAIAPTVLGLLGVDSEVQLDGASLLDPDPGGSGALSFCGEHVTLRRGDVRLWLRSDALHKPKAFDQWFNSTRYDLAPWFASDWVAAEYNPENPKQPVWIEGDVEVLREGMKDTVRARLSRGRGGRPGAAAGEVEEVDDEAFRRQLEELGYL